MSIKYMNKVWELEELKGGRLLVMLALADHANDAGECWPSQPHLAKKARLTDRQLRRVIESLVADGYVAVLDKGIGRSKRPHYRLFLHPVKADILSGAKADILSKVKSDISDTKADILSQEKRTFSTEKADILSANYSHVRSEPPIEPPIESPKESSSLGNDDDDVQRTPIQAAWFATFQIEMSPAIQKLADALQLECGEAAVIHGIIVSVSARERTWRYIAQSARNYIPPAPEQASRASYAVDLPGVYAMPAAPSPAPAPPPLPPMAHDDPWVVAMVELERSRQIDMSNLKGSTLARMSQVGRDALYRLTLRPGADADDVRYRAARLICRTLGSIVNARVEIEIVVVELEPTP